MYSRIVCSNHGYKYTLSSILTPICMLYGNYGNKYLVEIVQNIRIWIKTLPVFVCQNQVLFVLC
jgi:hypothetical protein